MNERIRLLANQMFSMEQFEYAEEFLNDEFLEKFAEMIVGECIQVGGPEDSYTDEWFKAKADSVAKIKEHFGVEE